jgi:DNA-binding CsgD family transcriptional regulator
VRRSNWGAERSTIPRRGRWSQAEIARLRELYGLRDEKSIARELNRPVGSVRKMAEDVFRAPPRTGPWTARELQDLKKYLGGTTTEVIARILGRNPEEVQQQVIELRRIQSTGRWTQDEVAEFKRLYGTRTDDDLAIIFGRTLEAVKRLGARYCLAKDKAFVRKLTGSAATRMPRWGAAELERLKELYPVTSNLDIAQQLNRSVKSVVSKAHNLGLKKEVDRLRQMGRENVSMRYKKSVT